MTPNTKNFALQKGASEGKPSNAPVTNQSEGQVQSTINVGEPAALQNENSDLNELHNLNRNLMMHLP